MNNINPQVALNTRNETEQKVEGASGVVEWQNSVPQELFYFAHPYSATDKRAEQANFQLCCIRTAKLISWGYFVYSPICHTHPIHIAWPAFLNNDERKLWIRLDEAIIKQTNFKGIILAPAWETSSGCRGEKELFEQQGKRVLLYRDIVKQKESI